MEMERALRPAESHKKEAVGWTSCTPSIHLGLVSEEGGELAQSCGPHFQFPKLDQGYHGLWYQKMSKIARMGAQPPSHSCQKSSKSVTNAVSVPYPSLKSTERNPDNLFHVGSSGFARLSPFQPSSLKREGGSLDKNYPEW